MNCSITMHWPVPRSVAESFRNVYVKKARGFVKLPEKGDIVLVYETKTATVGKGRVHKAELWRRRKPTGKLLDVPDGAGGIIGWMTVSGTKRAFCDDDVLLDYGNLWDEKCGFLWEIIPCQGWRCASLSRGDLMEALGKPRNCPPMFLRLYGVPDKSVSALRKLGLPAC